MESRDFRHDFEMKKDREAKQAAKRASIVLAEAEQYDPDQVAADRELGKAFGVSSSMAEASRDDLASRRKQDHNEELLKDNPRLATWLEIGDNAKLAYDDVIALTAMKRAVAEIAEQRTGADTGSGRTENQPEAPQPVLDENTRNWLTREYGITRPGMPDSVENGEPEQDEGETSKGPVSGAPGADRNNEAGKRSPSEDTTGRLVSREIEYYEGILADEGKSHEEIRQGMLEKLGPNADREMVRMAYLQARQRHEAVSVLTDRKKEKYQKRIDQLRDELRSGIRTPSSGIGVPEGVLNSFRRGTLGVRAFFPYMKGEINFQYVTDINKTLEQLRAEELAAVGPDVPDIVKQRARARANRRYVMIEGLTESDRKIYAALAMEGYGAAAMLLDRAARIPKSDIASGFEKGALTRSGNTVRGVLQALVEDPLGGIAFLTETSSESAPLATAAFGASVLTRNPAVGTVISTAGNYAQTVPTEAMSFLKEKGVDFSTPEAVRAALQNPALMKEANRRGVTAGLVSSALGVASGGVISRKWLKSPAGDAIVKALAQGFAEGGTEAAVQLATGKELNYKDITLSGLAGLGSGIPGIPGSLYEQWRMQAAEGIGPTPQQLKNLKRRQAAESIGPTLENLEKLAGKSKLANRSPEKFAEIVDTYVRGTKVETLYLDARGADGIIRDTGLTPEQFFEKSGIDPDQFRAALESGGDVPVSMGQYLKGLADTDIGKRVRDHLRFDPDDMTVSELARQTRNRGDRDGEAADGPEADGGPDKSGPASGDPAGTGETKSTSGEGKDPLPADPAQSPETGNPETGSPETVPEESRKGEDLSSGHEQAAKKPDATAEADASPAARQQEEADPASPAGLAREQTGEEIRKAMADRLVASGRTPEEAATEASVWPGFYTALEENTGIPARTLLEQFPLPQLQGVEAQAAPPITPDRLPQALEALRKRSGELKEGTPPLTGSAKDEGSAGTVAKSAGDEGTSVPDASGQKAETPASPFPVSGTAGDYFTGPELDRLQTLLEKHDLSADDDISVIRKALKEDLAADNGAGIPAGRKTGNEAKADTGTGMDTGTEVSPDGIGQGKTIVKLFQTANRATILQETGHSMLSVMEKLATVPDAHPEIVDMVDGVRGWWRGNAVRIAKEARRAAKGGEGEASSGVKKADVLLWLEKGTTGEAGRDRQIMLTARKQFARGFEVYLMEGKAPSPALRSAFETFRTWLKTTYASLAGQGVRMSPEIRGVMDRMLATGTAIDAVRQDLGEGLIYDSPEKAGLSAEQFAKLEKLHRQATTETTGKASVRAMDPIRRENDPAYRQRKKKVAARVETSVNARPVYRAIEGLANGRWLGGDAPHGPLRLKLDRDALVGRWGAPVLTALPRGKGPVYARGGADPDMVAELFGLGTADEMIFTMLGEPDRKEMILRETERLMYSEHGDVLTDGRMEKVVVDAIHNDGRGALLAAEASLLRERAGLDSSGDSAGQAAYKARSQFSRMKVGHAQDSRRFVAANRRATQALQELARQPGPVTREMARLADQRLLNHRLYLESRKLVETVGDIEAFAARVQDPAFRQGLEGGYLEPAMELLTRHGFFSLHDSSGPSGGALYGFVRQMTETGRESQLAIPRTVLRQTGNVPYRDLTVGHLQDVADSLANIEHLARTADSLVDAGSTRDLDTVVGDIVRKARTGFGSGKVAMPLPGQGDGSLSTPPQAQPAPVRHQADLERKANRILADLDGAASGGAAFLHIKAPVETAMAGLARARRNVAGQFENLYAIYPAGLRREMGNLDYIAELQGLYSRWDLISIALAMGNRDNVRHLLAHRDRNGFTQEQLQAVLMRLDARDARFIQSSWTMLDSYWPLIATREKRLTGIEPRKVEAQPVTIAGIELSGGYYPPGHDVALSAPTGEASLADPARALWAGRLVKARTREGHVRHLEDVARQQPVADISLLHGHINDLIHDLGLHETLNATSRIVEHPAIRQLFMDTGRMADHRTLDIWLQGRVSGEMRVADFITRFARHTRGGFTATKLASSLSEVITPKTELDRLVHHAGKGPLADGVMDMFRQDANPFVAITKSADNVMKTSNFMATRRPSLSLSPDIYQPVKDPAGGQGKADSFMAGVMEPLSVWLMEKSRFYTLDVPLWMASHGKALAEGKTGQDAITIADEAVAGMDGTAASPDMKSGEAARRLRSLGAYLYGKLGQKARTDNRTGQQGADPKTVIAWTADLSMLFALVKLGELLFKGRVTSPDDKKEKPGKETGQKTGQKTDKEKRPGKQAGQTGETDWQSVLAALESLPVMQQDMDANGPVSGNSTGAGTGTGDAVADLLARPFVAAFGEQTDPAFVQSLLDLDDFALMLSSDRSAPLLEATWDPAQDKRASLASIAMAAPPPPGQAA